MINLLYYQDNFGDELSPYIVSKLSGQDVKYTIPFNMKQFFVNLCACLKHINEWPLSTMKHNMSFTFSRVVVGLGSLLENSTSRCVCWGTGMAQSDKVPLGGNILLTRGPLSRDVLLKNGFSIKSYIGGDPALLMPLLYKPIVAYKTRIGLICHNADYAYIEKVKKSPAVHLIGLNTKNVEGVIDQICSCDLVYTTSLHGLIISHVYGVKAVWIERKQLPGGRFKFKDYLLSVGIEPYIPYDIETLLKSNFKVDTSSIQLLPNREMVSNAQQVLIDYAPFPIVFEFNKNETNN